MNINKTKTLCKPSKAPLRASNGFRQAQLPPQVNDSRSHIIQQSSNVFNLEYREPWASQVAPVIKILPAKAGDFRDAGSIPGSGRSPGGGHSNPLQCSCQEHPHGWWATVHSVAKSQTRLKRLSTAQ